MPYETIKVTIKNGLQIITFNRPEKKNAFNTKSYEEIKRALNEAASDNSVTITALTGAGDFYSSGNDLNLMDKYDNDSNMEAVLMEARTRIESFVEVFINFPKILIAVINGPCIGIAATTAALCDAVYASDKAYFYTPFTKLGLNAEGCSSYTFPKIFGPIKANNMLLLNYKLSAVEADNYGFVTNLFSNKDIDKIWKQIESFTKLPPSALLHSKKLIRNQERKALQEANSRECDALFERWHSDEWMNAMLNFVMEKQKKSKL